MQYLQAFAESGQKHRFANDFLLHFYLWKKVKEKILKKLSIFATNSAFFTINKKYFQNFEKHKNIFDNFTYNYLTNNNHLVQNHLYHVNDAVATGLASNEDISDPVRVPTYAF